MNRDYTNHISNNSNNKGKTYLNPHILFNLIWVSIVMVVIALLYNAITTRDWATVSLVLFGCVLCLARLYGTHRKIKAMDRVQASIESKSVRAQQHD